MSEKLKGVIDIIRFYGGLSLFFASYLSVCYGITEHFLVDTTQSTLSDDSHREPSVIAQLSQPADTKKVIPATNSYQISQRDISSIPAQINTPAEHMVSPASATSSPTPLDDPQSKPDVATKLSNSVKSLIKKIGAHSAQ